jgi:hypothetical protein
VRLLVMLLSHAPACVKREECLPLQLALPLLAAPALPVALQDRLARLVTDAYLQHKTISAETLCLVLRVLCGAELQPSSLRAGVLRGLVVSGVQAYEHRHGGLQHLWAALPPHQAAALVEIVARAMGCIVQRVVLSDGPDGGVEERKMSEPVVPQAPPEEPSDPPAMLDIALLPTLLHVVDSALRAAPQVATAWLSEANGQDNGPAFLQALHTALAPPASPRRLQPRVVHDLALLWLRLCVSLPEALRVSWCRELVEEKPLAVLLSAPWDADCLTGLLHQLGTATGTHADDARDLQRVLLEALLCPPDTLEAPEAERCVRLLYQLLADPSTRRWAHAPLTTLVPLVSRALASPHAGVVSQALLVLGELSGLSDAQRAHLHERCVGTREAEATQLKPQDAPSEALLQADKGLFLHAEPAVVSSGGGRRGSASVAAVEEEDLGRVHAALVNSDSTTAPDEAGNSDMMDVMADAGNGEEEMVMTPTTRANLERVLELSQGGNPLMIEGDTGTSLSNSGFLTQTYP